MNHTLQGTRMTKPGRRRPRRNTRKRLDCPRRTRRQQFEALEDRRLLAGELSLISLAETQQLASHAVDLWQTSGATLEQITALEDLRYEVADLGEHKLASYQSGKITIDDNAAGHLWFVDQTPLVHEEFQSVGGSFVA
ncbi:MAG: hypothetical protein AAF745_03960, partial [Planctomycetota bacterium]